MQNQKTQGTWGHENLGSKVEHASGCNSSLLEIKSAIPLGAVSHSSHGSIQETLVKAESQ